LSICSPTLAMVAIGSEPVTRNCAAAAAPPSMWQLPQIGWSTRPMTWPVKNGLSQVTGAVVGGVTTRRSMLREPFSFVVAPRSFTLPLTVSPETLPLYLSCVPAWFAPRRAIFLPFPFTVPATK
jgi:hypothetical protein